MLKAEIVIKRSDIPKGEMTEIVSEDISHPPRVTRGVEGMTPPVDKKGKGHPLPPALRAGGKVTSGENTQMVTITKAIDNNKGIPQGGIISPILMN